MKKHYGWILAAAACVPLLFQALSAQAQPEGWLQKAFDTRRTGQCLWNGPNAVSPALTWKTQLPAAFVINIGASVDAQGVYFGSWGVVRNDTNDLHFADKYDGKLYGLARNDGAFLWGGATDLDFTPYWYDFNGRTNQVNYHNGTVEGQAAIDPARNTLYVGRGDGKLYAVDRTSGVIAWRFTTYNPAIPGDPDGGGEVIASPLLAPDGTVYIATWGIGPYETNAVYAVAPGGGELWRYPEDSSLAKKPFMASLALSPDGGTVYAISWYPGTGITVPCTMYALSTIPGASGDAARLLWKTDLTINNNPFWATTLAVGADGTVYVGGSEFNQVLSVTVPALCAVRDHGDFGEILWERELRTSTDEAFFVGGIALRETAGQTVRLFATTANQRSDNANENGALYAVDLATGEIDAAFDPSDASEYAVGSLNSPAIGADGTLYFGVRGRYKAGLVDAWNGHVMAVEYDASTKAFSMLWDYEVDGHLEWNHPAIGPDGGLYTGSSVGGTLALIPFPSGFVPPNTSPWFYCIKGPNTGIEDVPFPGGDLVLTGVYPQPAAGEVLISIQSRISSRAEVRIYDMLGREAASPRSAALRPGEQHLQLETQTLGRGMYMVTVAAGTERSSRVIIKQ